MDDPDRHLPPFTPGGTRSNEHPNKVLVPSTSLPFRDQRSRSVGFLSTDQPTWAHARHDLAVYFATMTFVPHHATRPRSYDLAPLTTVWTRNVMEPKADDRTTTGSPCFDQNPCNPAACHEFYAAPYPLLHRPCRTVLGCLRANHPERGL